MDTGASRVIDELKTKFSHYQIIEEVYTGRPSRLLYSGKLKTAQSGIALDDVNSMLFDYNKRLVELVEGLSPKNLLLIGGGVYTLPTFLSSKYPDLAIDVVEPDQGLDHIAARYFNFSPSKQVNIIHNFGLSYLKKNSRTYDLIIIDAYTDYKVPDEILTKKFAKLALSALNPKGYLAANLITDLKANSPIDRMHSTTSKYFQYFKGYPVTIERNYFYPGNLIYVTSNQPIEVSLRYPSLSLSRL